jgi:NAD(P)-dependent dehydrogenase (short-subunit alcohol dehydrogenase family)
VDYRARSVIVTGASSGIGRQVALDFAAGTHKVECRQAQGQVLVKSVTVRAGASQSLRFGTEQDPFY